MAKAPPPAPKPSFTDEVSPAMRRGRSPSDVDPLNRTAEMRTDPMARTAPMPSVVARPPTPAPFQASAAPLAPAPAAAPALSKELDEQLFTTLRSALDATLVPLLQKQAELQMRLERLQKFAAEISAAPTPRAAVASVVAAAPPPRQLSAVPVSIAPSLAPASIRPGVTNTSFGLVMSGPSSMAPLDFSNVGPVDVRAFKAGNQMAGRILVGLLLAGLAGAILATILSYS